MLEEVRKQLFQLQDLKYQKFHSSLCPGVSNIIGVRTPDIRKTVKMLLKEDFKKYIMDPNKKYYEEIMIEGLLIAEARIPLIEKEKYLDQFIPKINCWAITDICATSFRFKKEELAPLWNYLKRYENSNSEYELRFLIVMWMDHYLIDDYIDEVLKKIDSIHSSYYYVNMAIAWLVSTSYIKYPKITMRYLNKNNLEDWTYNKAIQKIIESNRVESKVKKKFRKMKRM